MADGIAEVSMGELNHRTYTIIRKAQKRRRVTSDSEDRMDLNSCLIDIVLLLRQRPVVTVSLRKYAGGWVGGRGRYILSILNHTEHIASTTY